MCATQSLAAMLRLVLARNILSNVSQQSKHRGPLQTSMPRFVVRSIARGSRAGSLEVVCVAVAQCIPESQSTEPF